MMDGWGTYSPNLERWQSWIIAAVLKTADVNSIREFEPHSLRH